MRILLLSFFLLLGTLCSAQELVGPDRVLLGTLASFEIVPEQEASWHIVTPLSNIGTHQVDTKLSKLYFASPERGRYTVIAGIVLDGRPELLVKTFINGEEDVEPFPVPVPLPPTSLEAWIKTQLPILVKSENLITESCLVAECFEEIVQRIDDGNIKTPQNAQAQLQVALTGTLALASPTAVTEWMPFMTELSRRIETELGEQIDNLAAVKAVLQKVANAVNSLEKSEPVLRTPLQIETPNTRTPGTQNRVFRNLLAR
jgi:hypothetical protein